MIIMNFSEFLFWIFLDIYPENIQGKLIKYDDKFAEVTVVRQWKTYSLSMILLETMYWKSIH